MLPATFQVNGYLQKGQTINNKLTLAAGTNNAMISGWVAVNNYGVQDVEGRKNRPLWPVWIQFTVLDGRLA
ncbi:hypothetical protein C9J03_10300 [Photobacterium gaetbulicola]|nr:hypothetical protein C9J03_10300 [Photobacterium gaetbulicola]